MINAHEFLTVLAKNGFRFFTGVPCSIFKGMLSSLNARPSGVTHILATQEGEAVAIASGYHLATREFPVVYMQNSGLGNCVNPLSSLTAKELYRIPMLLLISWRGEPGKDDEPQHWKMGKITLGLLKLLDIPYRIVSGNKSKLGSELRRARTHLKRHQTPYALIFIKGVFDQPQRSARTHNPRGMAAQEAIRCLIEEAEANDIIVATTGKISRNLYFEREHTGMSHGNIFYMVGSMGSAAGLGFGIAWTKKKRKVIILDGDGATLMRMGTLGIVGHYLPENYVHVVFNNAAYDSTGGQPCVSERLNFAKIARSCGYRRAVSVRNKAGLVRSIRKALSLPGPTMIELKVRRDEGTKIGRPPRDFFLDNKKDFYRLLCGKKTSL
ncbi:MAG: phosphonopyruvate decarboxylase [Candidatus Omnitrophica bacterium]|nr:phosphonopyruvate decarboxylase [Candidatus Omnitrophota bacterium]